MSTVRTVLRVGGTIVLALGLMCLPVRSDQFRKADLSVFHNWADVGVFVRVGITLIAVGAVAVGLSFLIRRHPDDL